MHHNSFHCMHHPGKPGAQTHALSHHKMLPCRFFVGTWNMSGFLNEDRETRTLREIVTRLRESYCGSIGFEYMHIPDRDRCNWLRERIETPNKQKFSVEKQLHTYDRLAWSEIFESFLANKYAAAKRFGLEGCETLVPGMKAMIDTSADLGVETICLGMPHRGDSPSSISFTHPFIPSLTLAITS